MRADGVRVDHHPAGMDDIIDLLGPQRLTRELLDHLTAMFPMGEAAELLRAMADGLETRRLSYSCPKETRRRRRSMSTGSASDR